MYEPNLKKNQKQENSCRYAFVSAFDYNLYCVVNDKFEYRIWNSLAIYHTYSNFAKSLLPLKPPSPKGKNIYSYEVFRNIIPRSYKDLNFIFMSSHENHTVLWPKIWFWGNWPQSLRPYIFNAQRMKIVLSVNGNISECPLNAHGIVKWPFSNFC